MDKYITSDQITLLKKLYLKDVSGKYYSFLKHHWIPLGSTTQIVIYIQKNFNSKVKKIHESCFSCLIDKEFETKRDSKHLICFANGVYDLSCSKFRNGTPEDYCTYNTNIIYKYQNNSTFNYYIRTVFPQQEDYKQFLLVIYNLFKGNKMFVRSDWKDDSGRSTIYRLIQIMFGDYIKDYNHIHHLMLSDMKEMKTFKGRAIMASFVQRYDDLSISMITEKSSDYYYNLPILSKSTTLSFKSTFKDIVTDNPENYVFKKMDGLGHQMKPFSVALFSKIISIEQTPLKVLYFINNQIFVRDITDYILNLYDTLLYI